MSLLSLTDFGVKRGPCQVVSAVTLSVQPGEVIGLIGPNGAGKTSLMRAALGLLPSTGHSSLHALKPAERARQAAWLPQAREIAWGISVEALVRLGRLPHGGHAQPEDHDAVAAALAEMGLEDFAARKAIALSGGEQARVLIARCLAQQTPLILADEPIAGLDPAHQISTMAVFSRLAEAGKAVVVSLHDLGLAARHCTRLIMLARGGVVADGPPDAVLTPAFLQRYFNITAHLSRGDDGLIFQALNVVDQREGTP